MSFQTGLSGLNAASKSLDVISNNVANSGSVGFKSGKTEFSDLFASALTGASAGVQIGIGTAVGAVNQAFSQGSIAPTNNPLDVAINGGGFFTVQRTDGSTAYTRNGQFQVDKDGFVVGSPGYKLTGYQANAAGLILPAAPAPLRVETADLAPNVTTEVILGMNLDSRAAVFDPASVPPAPAFDATDPTTYSSSTAVTTFDSLGNSHVLTLFFRKIPASGPGVGDWQMFSQVDGGAATTTPVSLQFNSSGTITTGSPTTITVDFDNVLFGGATDFDIDLNLDSATQFGSPFGVNRQLQDGFASGRLAGVTVGNDGVIQGRYSNGEARNLGQIVLSNFQNPNGLLSLGGNLWAEGPASGQPLIGVPGSGSLGLLSAGSVEESNVDLTQELVDMITQQRAYQANAQSIRTQDQILQTLVNLR